MRFGEEASGCNERGSGNEGVKKGSGIRDLWQTMERKKSRETERDQKEN
jgi:hypothetical protein